MHDFLDSFSLKVFYNESLVPQFEVANFDKDFAKFLAFTWMNR